MKAKLIKSLIIFAICLAGLLSGCSDKPNDPGGDDPPDLNPPADFDYNNNTTVDIVFRAIAPDGSPINLVRCNVYRTRIDREKSENALMQGFTSEDGNFATSFPVAADQDSVFLKFNYVGARNEAEAAIDEGTIVFTLGQGISGKRFAAKGNSGPPRLSTAAKQNEPPFALLGSWASNGQPDYLATPDVITAGQLDTVNQVIPQGVSLKTVYPQYFDSGVKTHIEVLNTTNVWVTFIHNDTDQSNVFGFFTFPTGSPPATESDIDSLYVIFPHADFDGGLSAGSKVNLGEFAPGTSIGWAIVRNGWNNGTITTGQDIFYSIDELNPETDEDNQHFVMVHDANYKRSLGDRVLLTCDDNNLSSGSENFNFDDVIFYVTGTDGSFNTSGLPLYPVQPDCDDDGIPDYIDQFPCDADRAILVTYDWRTLAFEDDWPVYGDMDFNDLIIDAKYIIACDYAYRISYIDAKYIIRAMGTDKQNGFGLTFPGLSPSLISSVTGNNSLTTNMITNSPNGTEAGQSEATIIMFDNGTDLMQPPEAGATVNTSKGYPYVQPDTISVRILFKELLTTDQVGGWPPYNPFIIVDQERGREVHLRYDNPTDLADTTYFGTENDVTNTASGNWYSSDGNLPWALHFDTIWTWDPVDSTWSSYKDPWEYPFETDPINEAYLFFNDWANSGGSSNDDWYKNEDGYQSEEKIYHPFGIGKNASSRK